MTPDDMDRLDDATWVACVDLMNAEAASAAAAARQR
jgi:hypothetical protein